MDVTPIGILTRNRTACLDVTLRSLSATRLPADQSVRVFDDASDDLDTRVYLYDNKRVNCPRPWPQREAWAGLGLDVINEHDCDPVGIRDKVVVQKLGKSPLGVVNASCQMICRLFADFPQAAGVFLLQDDVVFNVDWRERILAIVGASPYEPVGLWAGCRLNRPLRDADQQRSVVYLATSTTAQCLYLSRDAFEKARGWFETHHKLRAGFDNHLCTAVRCGGFNVCLLNPAVCQHIGLHSLVRPKVRWYARGKRGRVCYEARPPYALADSVKSFCP